MLRQRKQNKQPLDLLDLSVMAWVLCGFSHQFGLLSLGYLAMSSCVGHAWFWAVVHCYWGCATGCACLDSTFPHVSFGHHALGDNSTISLIFAWHGNLACQVASPEVCMAA